MYMYMYIHTQAYGGPLDYVPFLMQQPRMVGGKETIELHSDN